MHADIVLVTFPARHLHSPFALYSLKANLGPWRDHTTILEIGPETAAEEAAEQILAFQPRIVGFNVYLWSVERTAATMAVLASVAPSVWRIAGGPQLTALSQCDPATRIPAQYCVIGEGETAFRELCGALLEGRPPPDPVRSAAPPPPDTLALPYDLYTETDLRHRILYAETMRGCPFRCAYCTSATSPGVRRIPLARLFPALEEVIARGARQVKLLDRSFNACPEHAAHVLQFFREQVRRHPDLRLHLELVPELLPSDLLARLADFPDGVLHLELGVQTLDPDVAARVQRRIDPAAILRNLEQLRRETGAELHIDLIFGLPGETIDGFAHGFDTLVKLAPQALQVNRLKRLPGTPLAADSANGALHFSPVPPYGVLQTDVLSFRDVLRLDRFARFWDRIHNRGRFPAHAAAWRDADHPFRQVMAFADFASARFGRAHAIARKRMAEALEAFDAPDVLHGGPPATIAAINPARFRLTDEHA